MSKIELRDNPLRGLVIGPKLAACSERERIFAYAYATGIAATAADAARLAGHKTGAKQRAYEAMHKPRVMEAIEEICRTEFRALIPLVISSAKRLLLNPKHPDHQKTVISLLSKLGYGDKATVDVKVSGEVQVSHTDQAVEDLGRLKELGVPREKLQELFGFSGLDRYEQLLAQRRTSKMIEHDPNEPAGSFVPTPQEGTNGPRKPNIPQDGTP